MNIEEQANACVEGFRQHLETIAKLGEKHSGEVIDATINLLAVYVRGLATVADAIEPAVLDMCIRASGA